MLQQYSVVFLFWERPVRGDLWVFQSPGAGFYPLPMFLNGCRPLWHYQWNTWKGPLCGGEARQTLSDRWVTSKPTDWVWLYSQWLVFCCKTGEHVAIKIIDKAKLNKEGLDQLSSEIRLWSILSEREHPNVVKLYQCIDTRTKLYLVMGKLMRPQVLF